MHLRMAFLLVAEFRTRRVFARIFQEHFSISVGSVLHLQGVVGLYMAGKGLSTRKRHSVSSQAIQTTGRATIFSGLSQFSSVISPSPGLPRGLQEVRKRVKSQEHTQNPSFEEHALMYNISTINNPTAESFNQPSTPPASPQ